MWFDQDMVDALRAGGGAHGWSGRVDEHGRTVIALDVLGVHHRWIITGKTCPHPALPGRGACEGQWPD